MSEEKPTKTETITTEDVKPAPFTLKPVRKKPTRAYRKGSKYDPIIEAFLAQDRKLVAVEVPEKDGNYLRTQLTKRIEAMKVKNVSVSVTNNVCYLEKTG